MDPHQSSSPSVSETPSGNATSIADRGRNGECSGVRCDCAVVQGLSLRNLIADALSREAEAQRLARKTNLDGNRGSNKNLRNVDVVAGACGRGGGGENNTTESIQHGEGENGSSRAGGSTSSSKATGAAAAATGRLPTAGNANRQLLTGGINDNSAVVTAAAAARMGAMELGESPEENHPRPNIAVAEGGGGSDNGSAASSMTPQPQPPQSRVKNDVSAVNDKLAALALAERGQFWSNSTRVDRDRSSEHLTASEHGCTGTSWSVAPVCIASFVSGG